MIAFILSSAIAFALFELLAFTQWPPTRTRFRLHGETTLSYTRRTATAVFNTLRALIIFALLLFVLAVHHLTSPLDILTRYEVSVVFGFVFGPLAAIWVNSIVLSDAKDGLSAGQILSIFGLMLLFFLGATGDQTSKLIGRYASSLSSVKLAGAELSFTSKQGGERSQVTSAGLAGTSGSATANTAPVTGRSQGLGNLAALDKIIDRDEKYLTYAFPPNGQHIPVEDLELSKDFASQSVSPAMSCLSAWFQNTGDPRPVDDHLVAYASSFRQLDVLNRQANDAASSGPVDDAHKAAELRRLGEIVSELVRNGLKLAHEIARSTADQGVLKTCKPWFDVYMPYGENDIPVQPGDAAKSEISLCQAGCLQARLDHFPSSNAPGADPVSQRISQLVKRLNNFIAQGDDQRGLESLPYFAIARASVMAQLDAHEAAATILDDWLKQRQEGNEKRAADKAKEKEYEQNALLPLKDDWLALRVRVIFVSYVEEWLELPASSAGSEVRSEQLKNLRILRDGLRRRLLKADFFSEIDKKCESKCEPVFRHPAECNSDEPARRLALFRSLYTSYVTTEYTYLHRLLESPDYPDHFADAANDEALRLVNLDMSCGAQSPQPDVVYAQSLLGFAENAVSYVTLRAGKDDATTQAKRLDDAERAVRLGLGLVEPIATEDRKRDGKRYLARITPSFATQTQELLGAQLKTIAQARGSLE